MYGAQSESDWLFGLFILFLIVIMIITSWFEYTTGKEAYGKHKRNDEGSGLSEEC